MAEISGDGVANGGAIRRRVARTRPPGHPIDGFSALLFFAVAGVIVWLAHWAGQPTDGAEGRSIQGMYGLVVTAVLGLLIVGYAWGHRFVPSVAQPPSALARLIEVSLKPIGGVLTWLDVRLVWFVAEYCGGGGDFPTPSRIAHFFLYFGIALLAAWELPRPWGLLGVGMALVGILALNRKWAWVEEDRRSYVLNGHYEVVQGGPLGIGFAHDYREVSLSALALMIVVMPAALMQTSAFGFFMTKDGSPIEDVSNLEWMIFFGGEMAKSVPFVDWSEVYGAQTITRIAPAHGGGQHTVFVVRALVDLVLLAGFLQVFDLSNRLARQQANFRDPENPERILDPFIEREAFKDLAKLAAPKRLDQLETNLIARMRGELRSFTKYSNQQVQRILWWGQAPEYWRPDHETAAALIVPYREGIQSAPQFFTQLYEQGVIWETVGGQAQARPANPRTQVAAIISVLGREGAAFQPARDIAYRELAKFLESGEDRAWAGAACALAELRCDDSFPENAEGSFTRALAANALEPFAVRTRLLHKALAHIANTVRPPTLMDDGRPHLGWTVELLLKPLREGASFRARRSAVMALETVEFRPDGLHAVVTGVLKDQVTTLRLSWWDLRRLAPWLPSRRLRREAARALDALALV